MTPAMLIFGMLTIVSACGVVLSKKPLNSALWLVLTFFLIAVHFALLGADFVAAVQILVYAGAIMVLVIFVIMLLGMEAVSPPSKERAAPLIAGLFTGIFIGALIFAVRSGVVVPIHERTFTESAPVVSAVPDTNAVGQALFTRFIYPFEITSLLLLAGIIGAVVLALEPKRPLGQNRGLKAMHQSGK